MIGMHKNSALRYEALRGFPGYLWEVALCGAEGVAISTHTPPLRVWGYLMGIIYLPHTELAETLFDAGFIR